MAVRQVLESGLRNSGPVGNADAGDVSSDGDPQRLRCVMTRRGTLHERPDPLLHGVLVQARWALLEVTKNALSHPCVKFPVKVGVHSSSGL
jgi:hypothetical protein